MTCPYDASYTACPVRGTTAHRYHERMTPQCMTLRDQLDLTHARILDGGMASELEFLGADISGPLWSAHILEDAPEKILEVHRAYLEAGTDILLTASYQVSRKAYTEYGLDSARADQALLRSVELAQTARQEFQRDNKSREVLIAASLGPYGAALHNGSEYHGNYSCSYADLVQFHQERIAVLAQSSADLLAFETLPSIEEARAIGEALKPWPNIAAWFSFNCPSARAEHLQVAHGEPLRDCAILAASFPQTIAIGVNCTQPKWLLSLIPELRQASNKPIVVYPNSGEDWDPEARCWIQTPGSSDPSDFGGQAAQWYAAGAQIVGGCCRTRPAHIHQIARP
jgi:homocysteine S-methyltransferase